MPSPILTSPTTWFTISKSSRNMYRYFTKLTSESIRNSESLTVPCSNSPLRKSPSFHCRDACLWLFRIGACRGKRANMNRAERRRQRKKAEKTAKNAKPVQSASPFPEQRALNIEQAMDLALGTTPRAACLRPRASINRYCKPTPVSLTPCICVV